MSEKESNKGSATMDNLKKAREILDGHKSAQFDVKMSMKDDSMNVVVTHKGRTKVYPVSPEDALALSKLLEKGATFMKGK